MNSTSQAGSGAAAPFGWYTHIGRIRPPPRAGDEQRQVCSPPGRRSMPVLINEAVRDLVSTKRLVRRELGAVRIHPAVGRFALYPGARW